MAKNSEYFKFRSGFPPSSDPVVKKSGGSSFDAAIISIFVVVLLVCVLLGLGLFPYSPQKNDIFSFFEETARLGKGKQSRRKRKCYNAIG
jgi:hypothetical protein